MKRLIFFLLFVLGWQIVVLAGVKAVFNYNYPSKNTLRSLVMENSPKGKAYGDYLLYAVNLGFKDTSLVISRDNIDILFNNLYSEEFILEEGDYKNSGYDDVLSKMVPSVGHKWQGFVWTFRIGTYVIRLIKTDCGNILITKVVRIKISPIIAEERIPDPIPVMAKTQPVSPDLRYVEREPREPYIKVDIPKEPKVTIKVWKFVIPVSAILAASIYYFCFRSPSHGDSYHPSDGDPRGRGQDPPPSGGEDGGAPVDPPPSGD